MRVVGARMRLCGGWRGTSERVAVAACKAQKESGCAHIHVTVFTKGKEEKVQREKDEKEDDERETSVRVRVSCVLGVVVCALCVLVGTCV